jgi:hypothetical protein
MGTVNRVNTCKHEYKCYLRKMNNWVSITTACISIMGGIAGGLITVIFKSFVDRSYHRKTKFFEFQAEALRDIYKKLYRLELAMEEIVSPTFNEGVTDEMRVEEFEKNYHEFYDIFQTNRILLPKTIKKIIEELINLSISLNVAHVSFLEAKKEPYADKESRAAYLSTFKNRKAEIARVNSQVPKIMEELENSFAKMLGNDD